MNSPLMAYIQIPGNLPGMYGLLAFRPAIAPALSALTNTLLCSDEGLSKGERELIGAYVSALNDCFLCEKIHGAVAQCHLGTDEAFLEQIKTDFSLSSLSDKMKALLAIAGCVQRGGKFVRQAHIDAAHACGASDLEIHDTVLITGLFCLFNRYVDGLQVSSDDTPETLHARAKEIAGKGYAARG
jgi:uncharacterized peroxidase-related enzyme